MNSVDNDAETYIEHAEYLLNLSRLLVAHAHEPVNTVTSKQADDYAEALTAVYPLILQELHNYTMKTISPVGLRIISQIPSQQTRRLIPSMQPIVQPTNVPVITPRQTLPKVSVGDFGKHYINNQVNRFVVVSVNNINRSIDILFEGGRQDTLYWRNSPLYPAGWYPKDTLHYDNIRKDRFNLGRSNNYVFDKTS